MNTETKVKHTQGEWKIFEGRTRHVIENEEGTGFVDVWIIGNVREEEALANAKLIAAAPDLLEALEEMMSGLTDEGLHHNISSFNGHQLSTIKKARLALKKATE